MASGGDDAGTLRIVMLGKTGMGKSSLGNSLLGKTPPKKDARDGRDAKPCKGDKDPTVGFNVGRGLTSETVYCAWDKAKRFDVTLEVTDTPGLCDTHKPEKLIYKEVAKSVAVAEPGPNVIIIVLRCDRRFTEEEYQAYLKIKQLFSDDINKYLILVFNGLDAFEEEEDIDGQRAALAEEIKKFGSPLQELIEEAGGRYFGMNNKTSRAERDSQIQDLTKMMLGLVRKNGNRCYKTEMTEEIRRRVEELVKDEARKTGVSQPQATTNVKQKIIQEEVSPGFFETIGGVISKAAKSVKDGVSEMCSVM